MPDALGGQKRVWDLQKLELWMVLRCHWGLGTILCSSARAAIAQTTELSLPPLEKHLKWENSNSENICLGTTLFNDWRMVKKIKYLMKKIFYYISNYVYVCLSAKATRGHPIPQNLSHRHSWAALTWMLGPKFGSSARTVCVLSY